MKRLYVGNLSYETQDQDLRELFSQSGEVTNATVIIDRDRNRSKGFAFVEMASDEAARAAVESLNGQDFQGRKIVVSEAREREERGGGGGGYGGGGGRPGGGGGGRGGDRPRGPRY